MSAVCSRLPSYICLKKVTNGVVVKALNFSVRGCGFNSSLTSYHPGRVFLQGLCFASNRRKLYYKHWVVFYPFLPHEENVFGIVYTIHTIDTDNIHNTAAVLVYTGATR